MSIEREEPDGFIDPSVFLARLVFSDAGKALHPRDSYVSNGDESFTGAETCDYVVLLDAKKPPDPNRKKDDLHRVLSACHVEHDSGGAA